MKKTMVMQVPVQPMEGHDGTDIHLQPVEDPTMLHVDVPRGKLQPVASPCRSRLHAGPTLEQPVPKGLVLHKTRPFYSLFYLLIFFFLPAPPSDACSPLVCTGLSMQSNYQVRLASEQGRRPGRQVSKQPQVWAEYWKDQRVCKLTIGSTRMSEAATGQTMMSLGYMEIYLHVTEYKATGDERIQGAATW